MDNHPIPQDITGFQFKLIGNMTIKQFIYLAIGGVLAWFFLFIVPLPGIIKWPLSIICLAAGAIFAFVPVDGRPMDLMLGNFIKALISPTQFVYDKQGGNLDNQKAFHSGTPNQIVKPIQSQPLTQTVNNSLPFSVQDNTMQIQAQQISTQPSIQSAMDQAINPSPVLPGIITTYPEEPTNQVQAGNTSSIIEDENKKLREELDNLKRELETVKSAPPAPPLPPQITIPVPQAPDATLLENQLNQTQREKDELQKQLVELQAKIEAPVQTPPPTIIQTIPKQTQKIRQVPQGVEKPAALPSAPEDPNLITGVIKDPRGNPVSNILVEIKDAESNPVRAFKTNALGKFASATSLSNGKYVITFEDSAEKHKFDAVEIELVGAPVIPLEIISVDPREELRRELFS
jgi:hypothetical protein